MKLLVLCGVFIFVQSVCLAQSISDLQKKKQQAADEIKYTTRLLNEAQKNENASLGKLRLINGQIGRRNTIISSINKEIEIYRHFIDLNALGVEMLKNDIKELKAEYAEIIRAAYKNKGANETLLFLLSAENFNQAYRRRLDMQMYTAYSEKQAETIAAVQAVLNENHKKLEEQKAIKEKLIGVTQQEKLALSKEKSQQNSSLQKLQKQRRKLQQTLKRQRKIEQELEREIQRIIEEEARKNRDKSGTGFALTPEQKLVGDNFEQNKRHLPWPVERGVIVEHFGVHRHPVLTNVQVQNNGVNIATETGAKVRAIFNGEVSRVFGISGGNTAVIIRHGKYLSGYSNLREVVVKTGDKVSTKQNIGTVYTDYDDGNKSILKFQIWKETSKLNPEHWIGK
jgi:septal ring factor EnvC (AmiA/AmiB activator)